MPGSGHCPHCNEKTIWNNFTDYFYNVISIFSSMNYANFTSSISDYIKLAPKYLNELLGRSQ